MEAVILAGGKGTRLRPFTTTLPKPLMPVGDHPIVSIVINQLREAGVTKITLAVNHLAELIISFFGTGKKFGVDIVYSLEDKPLGTVGPIRRIPDLPEQFLVMNGDVLTDLDYRSLYCRHLQTGAKLTIASYERDVCSDFGVLHVDKESARLKAFEEKPTFHFEVSMGVYIFSRSVLDLVPPDQPYGFDDLVHALLRQKEHVGTFPHRGYWLDLGRPDDYDRANQDFAAEKVPIKLYNGAL
jgi:NDP-sugar pyrophosphorylase family protein